MAAARSIHPTLYEVLSDVRKGKNWRASVVDGLQPEAFPRREGVMVLTPEQLLSARIPVQRLAEGDIKGYQRHLNTGKARSVGRWLTEHEDYLRVMGVVEISVDGNGNAFITDGQHRAAGAVIARLPLRVLITKRSESEARRLFASQAKASKPSRNVLIFDGDGPFEEYIQDAVTDPSHPWNHLITTAQAGTSKTRMSATAALNMLVTYVGRSSHRATVPPDVEARFDRAAADELATLVSAFGSRATNPLAFGSTNLRAIAMTARLVFRDRKPNPEDRDRWVRYMSRFPFANYSYLRSQSDVTDKMVIYWNKRLSDERKVRREER